MLNLPKGRITFFNGDSLSLTLNFLGGRGTLEYLTTEDPLRVFETRGRPYGARGGEGKDVYSISFSATALGIVDGSEDFLKVKVLSETPIHNPKFFPTITLADGEVILGARNILLEFPKTFRGDFSFKGLVTRNP